MNPYESDRSLAEYLLFHYGAPEEILPYPEGPREALGYPIRCVTECVEPRPGARALDLGCAVGRSTFELARTCGEVVGLDLSQRFIAAARELQRAGSLPYRRLDEGDLSTFLTAAIPTEIPRERVSFEVADATALPDHLGAFDIVLMANLIDRLREPVRCLARLPDLVVPGGQLVLSSPYTWLEEYTPRAHWLGGRADSPSPLAALQSHLEPAFELQRTVNLPFLIREHARKFQWSVAQASLWRRSAHERI